MCVGKCTDAMNIVEPGHGVLFFSTSFFLTNLLRQKEKPAVETAKKNATGTSRYI